MKKFEISHFQAVHCVRENAISPKVFSRFLKTFHPLKDVENRYLGRKFHGRSYFSFAMLRWKLLQKENLKFPNSKLHTVPEKMLYRKRYWTDFQKLSFCGKMWKIGIRAISFMGAAILVLQSYGENFLLVEKIRNFPLSSSTLCQRKCYIIKGIQPLFKNFPSAERCGK